MNSFYEILKIILPASAVFLCAYFLVKNFLDSEKSRREDERKKAVAETITPIRITAYERLTVFLDRIHPINLVVRMNRPNLVCDQFQIELIQTIKDEFDHNVSQQIYISNQAWELVKTAKEETIKIINISSQKVSPKDNSLELAKIIIQLSGSVDKLPSQIALENLKKEFARLH